MLRQENRKFKKVLDSNGWTATIGCVRVLVAGVHAQHARVAWNPCHEFTVPMEPFHTFARIRPFLTQHDCRLAFIGDLKKSFEIGYFWWTFYDRTMIELLSNRLSVLLSVLIESFYWTSYWQLRSFKPFVDHEDTTLDPQEAATASGQFWY